MNNLKKSLVTLLFLNIFIFTTEKLFGESERDENIWFNSIEKNFVLSPQYSKKLIYYIYSKIAKNEKQIILSENLFSGSSPQIICLTYRSSASRLPEIFIGTGRGYKDAADSAIKNLKKKILNINDFDLKIDFVISSKQQKKFEIRRNSIPDPSLYGVAFSQATGFTFLPQQLLCNNFIDKIGRLVPERISEYLYAKDKDIKVFGIWNKIATNSRNKEIFFFSTASYFIDSSGKIQKLLRGHPVYTQVSFKQIKTRMILAIRYMLKMLNENYSFQGGYIPSVDKYYENINIYDQISAAYSLLEVYEFQKSKKIQKTTKKIISFLLEYLKEYKYIKKSSCIVEDSLVDINTNAKMLMLLIKYAQLTDSEAYKKQIIAMIRYFIQQQRSDGSFISQRFSETNEIIVRTRKELNGELVLCLLMLHKHTGNKMFLKRASLATDNILSRQINIEMNPYIVEALHILFNKTDNKKYIERALNIGLTLTKKQNNSLPYLDGIGTFGDDMCTMSTAQNTRTCSKLLEIVNYYDLKDIIPDVKDALFLGLLYQFQNQHNDSTTIYFPNPKKIKFGFAHSIFNSDITLQTMTATISSFAQILKVMEKYKIKELIPTDKTKKTLQEARQLFHSFSRLKD
ncbi:MAG: hypothetical protein U9O87_04735 [Verrucomicrobiota bacterium]|nr:hypothetical protein [Verrucomicrobiota bacterium]